MFVRLKVMAPEAEADICRQLVALNACLMGRVAILGLSVDALGEVRSCQTIGDALTALRQALLHVAMMFAEHLLELAD